MKSNKKTLVLIGMLTTLGAAQKFYTFQNKSQLGSVELSSNDAQNLEQKKVIPDYKTSPNLLEAMVNEAEGKKIIVVNNIGFSAAEYGDKDLLVKVAQADLLEKAKFLYEYHRGGIIEVVAGGTTEGIGRVIGAALDKTFLANLSEVGVIIKTNGVVSEKAKGGIDMRLDRTAQTADPKGTWEAMNDKGLRSVPELNIAAIENSFRNNSSVVSAPLYVREGGGIGMKEAMSYIMEIKRFAMEHNITVEEVSKRGPLILQIGLGPGLTSLELAKNKGPKAATQLLFALNQMAEAFPEFRDLVLKMNIEVQFITKDDAKRTNFVLNSEEKLKYVTSKALSLDFSHATILPYIIEETGKILDKDKNITKEALEKELRILTEDELKQKAKDLRTKVEELAKISSQTNEAQITNTEIKEINTEIKEIEKQIERTFLYRNALAYDNALPTLINEIVRLNEIYRNLDAHNETKALSIKKQSILDLVKTLDGAVTKAKLNAKKFSLVVAEGGVVRAKTIAEKAIDIVKRK